MSALIWRERSKVEKGIVVLAALLTIVVSSLTLWDQWSGDDSIGASTASVAPDASPGRPAPTITHEASTAPQGSEPKKNECLAGSQVVNCQLDHTGQVIGSGSACGEREMLNFLGGQQGRDSLLAGVTASPMLVGGRSVCALQLPQGMTLQESASDLLSRTSGDIVRKCFDSVINREIGCSEPHTLEVVFSKSGSGSGVDCGRKLEEFLGRSASTLSRDLKLLVRQTPSRFECAIELRGQGVLTGSLRRLGDREVPVVPRSEARRES